MGLHRWHRSVVPAAATYTVPLAATAGSLALMGAAATLFRRVRRARVSPTRTRSGGCDPDVGMFIDAPLVVHGVDGTNQGLAIAILRERNFDADENAVADPATGQPSRPAEPLEVEYPEALRSFVEVAMVLAMEMAEHDLGEEHDCDDENGCELGDMGTAAMMMLLNGVAGRKLLEFAQSYEKFGTNHARVCRVCRKAGLRSPMFFRARFCRDLADDLMTNFDDDTVTVNGVPLAAATEVIQSMLDVIEQAYDVPAETQIARLTAGVAASIFQKETSPQPRR